MKKSNASLILALDNCEPIRAEQLVRLTREVGVSWFKVGLELFIQTGPEFVQRLKSMGVKVFLDLKLHDIPNTVEKSVLAATRSGADFLTIHLSGGHEMVRLAQAATKGTSTKLLGVTLLTSFTEKDLGAVFQVQPKDRSTVVLHFLDIAIEQKIPGVVCSAQDLMGPTVKLKTSSLEFLVTPGIRLAQDQKNDQVAVATPEAALSNGATHLVVGRPITAFQTDSEVQSAAELFLKKIEGN